MPAIEVENVVKEYRLGALHGLKQTVLNAGARLLRRPIEKAPLFKALDDVSFSIEQGEVVGIIGHNGAGKSTLLKLLAGISKPTRGRVKVNGRIAPLIEVGAGFVPDFTGRENVYLNASIMGMPKKEIDRKFDEIVDFAETREFIDTPVKRYSSGMQVKLAFAVATSIEAEILIVDEVLAVGDLSFQRKCFDRMDELIRKQGRTVLLVSHNIRQVERMCSRTILLDHGKVLHDDSSNAVCNIFYELNDKESLSRRAVQEKSSTLSSGDIDLLSVAILDRDGNKLSSISHLGDVEIRAVFQVHREIPRPIFGFGVHTTDFLYLATRQSLGSLTIDHLSPGQHEIRFQITGFPFLPGVYSLRLGVALEPSFQPVFYQENVIPLLVTAGTINRAVASNNGTEGFVELNGLWSIHSNTADSGDASKLGQPDQGDIPRSTSSIDSEQVAP
ncbi:MAG TPA: ABC transporter ATP-binding protein [Burkholderiaceae bacterium]|nr:ABC transporter ATP-binding protein [Burkholderiaceae bacterium]